MATPTPAPTGFEARLIALEEKIVPLVAANSPKISTKVAALLTAIVTGLGYVLASQVLPPSETAAVTVIVGGLTSFLTAEAT